MTKLIYHCRPLLLATVVVIFLAAGVEAGGFVYKPTKRGSDDLHLTTDFAGYWRFSGDTRHPNSSNYYSEPNLMLSMDVGLFKNLDAKSGVGGGIFAATTSESYRYGLRSRYRRWIGKYGKLDISPGLIVGGEFEGSNIVFPGLSGTVSYSPMRYFSLVSVVEVIQQESDGSSYVSMKGEKWTSATISGGVRMESYAGAIGVVLAGAAAVVLVIVIISAMD